VRRFLGNSTWTGDDSAGLRHEADYLVEVEGDLDQPTLEWSKHPDYGWFGPHNLDPEVCGNFRIGQGPDLQVVVVFEADEARLPAVRPSLSATDPSIQ
jgi:hypothetical protein